MKKAKILFIAIAIIPFIGWTQPVEDLDYISPFHEDVAAIQKNGQWAFINREGAVVINFRDDLVIEKTEQGSYPKFYDNRCLIKTKREGITYFGYIDKSGKSILKPEFLNATNFKNGLAIVLELVKEDKGENEILGKKVVYYKYYEVIIETNGENKMYLTPGGVNVVLDKKFLKEPPRITSKLISDQLIVAKGDNGKLAVRKIN